VAIGVVALLLCVLSLLPMFATSSIWMPRYVGLVFPALAIVAAALIARQPTWWLRGLTLIVFITVNLSQFGARVYGQSEAPVDLMAADLVRSQPKSKIATQPDRVTFRAYYNYPLAFSGAPPGKASLFNSAGNYYLRILSGIKSDPKGIRRSFYVNNFNTWDGSTVDQIVRNVRSSPELERFVVWTGHRRGTVDLTDPVGEALRGRFDRMDEQSYEAHDHWTWIHWWTFSRREYVRVSRPEGARSVKADAAK
jgi:hypothetical protein